MEKKFIKTTYDKFNQKTVTRSIPEFVKLGNIGNTKLKIGIRLIKTPDFESLVFDVILNSSSWLFIRNGEMILSIDNNINIKLKAHENYSKVLGYQNDVDMGIEESVFYQIEKHHLVGICISDTFEIRVTGDSYMDFSGKHLDNFKLLCKQFYNNYFDENQFKDSLNETVKKPAACFIATATMGDYDHPVVVDLRIFRDKWLLKRNWGIQFTNWYYTNGPKASCFISNSKFLKFISFILIVKPLQLCTKLVRYTH